MIQFGCCTRSEYSCNALVSTTEIRKDQHISLWQIRNKSSIQSPSIGIRFDNRFSPWQKDTSSFGSPQFINAENVHVYYGEVAVPFGLRDPIETMRQRGVKIPQLDAVQRYIHSYPELSSLLTYASMKSQDTFGSSQAQLSLEVYHDVETDDEYLTLYVRQSEYDPDIMKKIKQIRRKCRGLVKGSKGRFLLTTDFRSPR